MYCRFLRTVMISLIVILSIGSMTGCSEESSVVEDQISEDLDNYLEYISQQVEKQEEVVTSSYRSVTNENYTDAENMYKELTETTLPETEILLKKLKNINPETEEVNQLHKILVTGWENQYEAFKLFVEAIEKKDQDLIEEGNLLLEDGVKRIDEFKEKREQMRNNHDL